MIDLNRARLVHMKWLRQMEGALSQGKIPKMERHEKCDLGRWIYREGMSELGERPAMLELERKHRRFHATADEMVGLFRIKNYVEAEVLLRELDRESKDLIFLLTRIEYDRLLEGDPEALP
ncbi:MAG: CZB domain-containing protein [Magnetococcales bacterium]|nr:CZB domain-containing protein [Magnetococcales bacterium]